MKGLNVRLVDLKLSWLDHVVKALNLAFQKGALIDIEADFGVGEGRIEFVNVPDVAIKIP